MKVTIDELKKVSGNAKLIFTDNELEKMSKEFELILNNFETADNLNLDDINLDKFDKVNTEFRKDEVEVLKIRKSYLEIQNL